MSVLPRCMTSFPSADLKPGAGPGPITGGQVEEVNGGQSGGQLAYSKRKCGCVRTSEKLKQIIETFPAPPPPTPMVGFVYDKATGYNYGHAEKIYKPMSPGIVCGQYCTGAGKLKKQEHKAWRIVTELVSLVQMSVTATALVLYYLIYCYMQLVYYILRSALYFHNADGPMKITIAVVTVTSLIIGFNILLRMEGLIGIVY